MVQSKGITVKLCLLIIFFVWSCASVTQPILKISSREALKIGVKIWYNESSGTITGLTNWNRGENFASIGIGHFIWYPANTERLFQESFPSLIKYMEAKGITVPYWLQGQYVPPCPWITRSDFLASLYSSEMVELRQFLLETIPWQASFMAQRLEKALPDILDRVSPNEQNYIRQQFFRVAQSPQGVYALVDYVNFKGEGVNPDENYRTHGWGLLQVLEQMRFAPQGVSAVRAFSWAANQVLTRRVEQAPPWRNEQRWLLGWRKRLRTYYS